MERFDINKCSYVTYPICSKQDYFTFDGLVRYPPCYMIEFIHLPSYASFLLKNHLDAYTREAIRVSFDIDVPLLKFFRHLTEEALFQLSKEGNIELLTKLSENKAKEHMEEAIQQWINNQLPVVGKFDIQAKDITLINHVRSKVLKSFLLRYTSDVDTLLKLNTEIDEFILEYNTTSTDAYIDILKGKIEEETHFSTNLVNASPGITFIYDIEQKREVYINGKVKDIMGVTPEEVIAMPDIIQALTHREDLPIVAAFMNGVLNDKEDKTYQAEYRFKAKNGDYHWLRCYAVVYKRNEESTPTQILGAAYEISNEKEIAASLIKRENQLLEAQSIACIGSYEWDMVADTSVSSPQLRKIFEADYQQTYAEMLQKVHPEDKEKLEAAMEVAYRTGDFRCEYRYRAGSGEKIIDAKGIINFDAEGRPLTMSGTVQDITDRKAIESQLFQKTIELEQSNVRLQEFASVASHDLKEPLRKIAMFSSIILSSNWDELPEGIKSNVQKIMDSASRMQQLIEAILSYSSIDAGEELQWTSLEDVVQTCLNNLEYRIKDTTAVVSTDGLPEAKVSPFQMQQLFQNLIGNALKFSKKDTPPEITITHKIVAAKDIKVNLLQAAGKYLQIEVKDNGIGFNDSASEKIFSLFQRLHSKNAYEGSGLGLAICRKVIENHGGAIYASSKEGLGSTFTMVLPYNND